MSPSETFILGSYSGKSRFCFVLKYVAQKNKTKNRQWHPRHVPCKKTEATTHAVNSSFIFFFRRVLKNLIRLWFGFSPSKVFGSVSITNYVNTVLSSRDPTGLCCLHSSIGMLRLFLTKLNLAHPALVSLENFVHFILIYMHYFFHRMLM